MKTIGVALIIVCATAGVVAQGSSACALAPGSSPGDGLSLGIAVAYLPAMTQDQEKAPPDSVFVDVMPGVKKKAEPKYPELAAKAGIEGQVWVKIWVDRDGKPREVKILKSDNEIFNQSAIEASRGFEFTPAMAGGKPVSIWITVPFKFKLMEKTTGAKVDEKAVQFGLQSAVGCISTILTGEETAKCKSSIAADAYAVIGSRYMLLADAVSRRGTPKGLPDEQGWRIDMIKTHMDDAGQVAALIVRTVGKKGEFHYHTVVCTKEGGEWRIRHWHTAG